MSKKRKSVKPKFQRETQEDYDYHLPVLLKESVDALMENQDLASQTGKYYYIDGTLGGGGHTSEILRRLKVGGKLLAFDKDPDAIENAKSLLSAEVSGSEPRLELFNQCFSQAYSIKETQGKVKGILLDLGVSSKQLDTNNRGISYRVDSNLDMRFGVEGPTAKDFLHSASPEQLERAIREFGEEPFSRVIARRIVERRRANTLNTTFDLRIAIEQSVPQHLLFKALSRVFQAIRIAVNSELDVLKSALENIVPNLEIGGRIVVISYHSLEDRIVKSTFKTFTAKDSEPRLKILTKKPMEAGDEELVRNYRARSGKLRIAERIS